MPKAVAVALHLAEPYDGYDSVIGAVAIFSEGDGVLILIHVGAALDLKRCCRGGGCFGRRLSRRVGNGCFFLLRAACKEHAEKKGCDQCDSKQFFHVEFLSILILSTLQTLFE